MTQFHFGTSGARTAVALVAAHGMTDLDSPHAWIPAYLVAWTPMQSRAISMVFALASMEHFATDVGYLGSILLHTCVGAVTVALGTQAGLTAMGVYLVGVHVPSHYARCAARGRLNALRIVTVSSAVAVGLSAAIPRRLTLTDGMQRTVIGHVLTEAQIAHTKGAKHLVFCDYDSHRKKCTPWRRRSSSLHSPRALDLLWARKLAGGSRLRSRLGGPAPLDPPDNRCNPAAWQLPRQQSARHRPGQSRRMSSFRTRGLHRCRSTQARL